eukprot:scpid10664/ scgid24955/ 
MRSAAMLLLWCSNIVFWIPRSVYKWKGGITSVQAQVMSKCLGCVNTSHQPSTWIRIQNLKLEPGQSTGLCSPYTCSCHQQQTSQCYKYQSYVDMGKQYLEEAVYN